MPNRKLPPARRERLRAAARITPAGVRRLRSQQVISPRVAPFVAEMTAELGDLLADKGDAITVAERAVCEDLARLGLVLRVAFGRYVAAPSMEMARLIVATAAARRAGFAVLGLERRARTLDLHTYL